MDAVKSHKDLIVYQKALDLVEQVYRLSRSFPDSEKFSLTSQIRRASVSVPSNIAEGAGRKSKKEFVQFLYIAIGSLNEVETQLEIAKRLQYSEFVEPYFDEILHIKRMLLKLIQKIETSG